MAKWQPGTAQPTTESYAARYSNPQNAPKPRASANIKPAIGHREDGSGPHTEQSFLPSGQPQSPMGHGPRPVGKASRDSTSGCVNTPHPETEVGWHKVRSVRETET
jgi:hypothetical protein